MTENKKIKEIKELTIFIRKQEKRIVLLSESMVSYRLLYNMLVESLEKIVNK